MHSVLLNQLGTFAVLFSIPKLLDKRTRPTVSTVATDVWLWCSRIRQLYVSTGVQLKYYILSLSLVLECYFHTLFTIGLSYTKVSVLTE